MTNVNNMSQDYSEYLAINVLNEQQLVRGLNLHTSQIANIYSGQLSLAEQSVEGPQQFSEAVRKPG